MLNFKEKRTVKRFLYSKITIVLLAIILVFLLNSAFGVYKKAKFAYENKERVSGNLTELQERETALLINIEKLKTNRGIESEIREKFGVVKNGEEVVVIVDSKTEKEEDSGQSTMNPRGLWQRFIGFFKRN